MNIRISISFLILSLLIGHTLKAQEAFRVMFYNVENLYDTINNPHTQDEDFTPDGNLHWNSYRYQKKLEDISKVISSLGGKFPPALVGLCEIENADVLNDLTLRSSLSKHKYRYAITKSKDPRGANIALLYQRDQYKLISKRSYTPAIDKDSHKTTRDILHITGQVVNGDTLDIFICHYPSRNEGIAKSEPYRIEVSKLLKQKIDSLQKKRRKHNILIMGDFNDYPNNKSIKEILKAEPLSNSIDPKKLFNISPSESLKEKHKVASYKYNGSWGFLDQFIINGNLLNKANDIYIVDESTKVYAPDYLLNYDERHGGQKPYRTYSGWKYVGGTSDHLPIYFDLFVKEF